MIEKSEGILIIVISSFQIIFKEFSFVRNTLMFSMEQFQRSAHLISLLEWHLFNKKISCLKDLEGFCLALSNRILVITIVAISGLYENVLAILSFKAGDKADSKFLVACVGLKREKLLDF